MYDVIVINPTSIIHLFEPKSDTAKQIDKMLGEGSSGLKLDSDSTLESIGAELELREHELRQFLSKGGLLVYFLAPPFMVSGSSIKMDNYIWLYECSPDKVDNGNRTMTPVRGRDINILARGKEHAFAPYLQQLGLDWSCYIRKENMTEGYKSLANGGAGKCLAAYKTTGPKKGQVVFLPAPYETRYDDVLKECLQKWHDLHTGPEADKPEADVVDDEESEPDIEGREMLNNLFADDSDSSKKTAPYPTPATSAGSDFDSLDALFAPSAKGEGKSSDEQDEKVKLFADDDPLKNSTSLRKNAICLTSLQPKYLMSRLRRRRKVHLIGPSWKMMFRRLLKNVKKSASVKKSARLNVPERVRRNQQLLP
jgi:hypothetical protein